MTGRAAISCRTWMARISRTCCGQCDPAKTLFIVASKTFTTIETMTNAQTAKDWLATSRCVRCGPVRRLRRAMPQRPPNGAFPVNSVWDSRIGSAGAIPSGGRSACRSWSPSDRMPSRPSCVELRRWTCISAQHRCIRTCRCCWRWSGMCHNQIQGHATRAVLPYDNRLARLPAYLQQLEMESNGKGVSMDGTALELQFRPRGLGRAGHERAACLLSADPSGHADGAVRIPGRGRDRARTGPAPSSGSAGRQLPCAIRGVDAGAIDGRGARDNARQGLEGAELERQAAHRVFPGNRPSTTLVYPLLTPEVLGKIIALYEHRVFVEGAMLGINSYDQWGVELGKELATSLGPVVTGEAPARARTDPPGSWSNT